MAHGCVPEENHKSYQDVLPLNQRLLFAHQISASMMYIGGPAHCLYINIKKIKQTQRYAEPDHTLFRALSPDYPRRIVSSKYMHACQGTMRAYLSLFPLPPTTNTCHSCNKTITKISTLLHKDLHNFLTMNILTARNFQQDSQKPN